MFFARRFEYAQLSSYVVFCGSHYLLMSCFVLRMHFVGGREDRSLVQMNSHLRHFVMFYILEMMSPWCVACCLLFGVCLFKLLFRWFVVAVSETNSTEQTTTITQTTNNYQQATNTYLSQREQLTTINKHNNTYNNQHINNNKETNKTIKNTNIHTDKQTNTQTTITTNNNQRNK